MTFRLSLKVGIVLQRGKKRDPRDGHDLRDEVRTFLRHFAKHEATKELQALVAMVLHASDELRDKSGRSKGRVHESLLTRLENIFDWDESVRLDLFIFREAIYRPDEVGQATQAKELADCFVIESAAIEKHADAILQVFVVGVSLH